MRNVLAFLLSLAFFLAPAAAADDLPVVTLDEARVDLKPVPTVHKGEHFSMKCVKIRPSDKLYKLVSIEELKRFKGLDVEHQRG